MSDRVRLEVLDPECAGADQGATVSRGEFLTRAVLAGGSAALGGVLISGLPRVAASAPSAAMDREILNFLLLLEHLQEQFYDAALAPGRLTGELQSFAETARENEREHIAYLRRLLGSDARDAPAFDFGTVAQTAKDFQAAAAIVEETTVAGYIGQGANLTKANVLSAARIVSVEARHAAWIRDIIGRLPAPAPADTAKSERQVMRTIRRKGWLR